MACVGDIGLDLGENRGWCLGWGCGWFWATAGLGIDLDEELVLWLRTDF